MAKKMSNKLKDSNLPKWEKNCIQIFNFWRKKVVINDYELKDMFKTWITGAIIRASIKNNSKVVKKNRSDL